MTRPILQAILAIALLSAMDAAIKALVARLPVWEVTFLRYLVGSAWMLALLAWARPARPSGEALKANLVRAVVVVVTATSFFYALGELPLAETLVLSFISPACTALLAALLLGERPDRKVLGALAAGFAGVLVIAAGGLEYGTVDGPPKTGSLLGVSAVIVAAIGYSASNVLLRARARHDPVVTIVAIQNIAPALILAPPAAHVWVAPGATDWPLIGLVGTLGVAGHLILAQAYAAEEATRLAPLDYTALVWAVLFGTLVFGEVPGPAVWLGGALIIGSAWRVGRR